jgi:ketosteroid isomerase-like protein
VSIEENKELALSWIKGMYDHDESWQSMLHEDFRYWAIGQSQDKSGFIGVVENHPAGQYTLKIGPVTAEGDRVMIEAEPSYDLPDGRNYTNFYLFAIEFRDGKVYRYRAHNDVLQAFRIFGPSAGIEPEVRASPFDEVLMKLGGPTPQPAESS